MKFVLFRHAHKGILPFDDPELSLPGFEQALQILNLVKSEKLPTPTRLLVSPRRRTSQTFYPLSKNLELTLEMRPELDQGLRDEGNLAFRNRVQNFLKDISAQQESTDVVFACTHYDWIEAAMGLINCDKDLNSFEFSHWSPTQYIVFEVKAPHWFYLTKGSAK